MVPSIKVGISIESKLIPHSHFDHLQLWEACLESINWATTTIPCFVYRDHVDIPLVLSHYIDLQSISEVDFKYGFIDM